MDRTTLARVHNLPFPNKWLKTVPNESTSAISLDDSLVLWIQKKFGLMNLVTILWAFSKCFIASLRSLWSFQEPYLDTVSFWSRGKATQGNAQVFSSSSAGLKFTDVPVAKVSDGVKAELICVFGGGVRPIFKWQDLREALKSGAITMSLRWSHLQRRLSASLWEAGEVISVSQRFGVFILQDGLRAWDHQAP